MSEPPAHILFSGGGTLGHVFPALAVAEALWRRGDFRLSFAGTGKALERRLLVSAGLEYMALPSRPLPRRPREAWSFVADNLAGFRAADWLLRSQRVSLVVGLGGYASAPAGRAALRRNVPLVLLESNAVAGRVTRWLAPRAAMVCSAFAETAERLGRRARVELTGTPVREIAENRRPAAMRRLLVLGGSGGAAALNRFVPLALYKARAAMPGWQIVHQTGEAAWRETAELYRKLGLNAEVFQFIDELPRMLPAIDLAISRAGGSTIAELIAAGLPSVLLPFPGAADDHQGANAQALAVAGACRVVDQRHIERRLDDALAVVVAELAAGEVARRRMAAAALALARPRAASRIADIVATLAARPELAQAG